MRSDLRVTVTNIRKWIVTTCHEKTPRGVKFDKDIVRQGLCHSDKTTKSFYLRSDLTSVAAQALEIITMCTSKKPKEAPVKSALTPVAEWLANVRTAETSDQPKSMGSHSLCEGPDTIVMPVMSDATSVPEEAADISDETSLSAGPHHNMILVPSEVSSVSAEPAAIPATNPNSKPSAQTNTKPKQQKRPLNDLEKSDTGQVFQDMIKSHQKVTVEAVRGKLKNSTKLQ